MRSVCSCICDPILADSDLSDTRTTTRSDRHIKRVVCVESYSIQFQSLPATGSDWSPTQDLPHAVSEPCKLLSIRLSVVIFCRSHTLPFPLPPLRMLATSLWLFRILKKNQRKNEKKIWKIRKQKESKTCTFWWNQRPRQQTPTAPELHRDRRPYSTICW